MKRASDGVLIEKPLKYKAFPRIRDKEFHRANLRL